MRIKDRRLLQAAIGIASIATVVAFVVVGGSGAGAAPGNGKAVGADKAAIAKGVAAAPESGSVGGGQSSGDTTAPQPPSSADYSGHGANVHGPYDSTRDGSPALNGNGTGNAVGKPCAGCVGKADNKNPPGQMPGGSDANAGYECDRNHGVGRTNPAHTGCTSTTLPPCETDCGGGCTTDCGGGCTTDCGGGCRTDCGGGCTTDCGGDTSPGAPQQDSVTAHAAAAQAVPAAPAAAPSGPLANTGAVNARLLAGIAALLVALGVVALTISSRLARAPGERRPGSVRAS